MAISVRRSVCPSVCQTVTDQSIVVEDTSSIEPKFVVANVSVSVHVVVESWKMKEV